MYLRMCMCNKIRRNYTELCIFMLWVRMNLCAIKNLKNEKIHDH